MSITQPLIIEAFDIAGPLPVGAIVMNDAKLGAAALKQKSALVVLVNLRENAAHLSDAEIKRTRDLLSNRGMWWTAANLQRHIRTGKFKALAAAFCTRSGLLGTIEMGTRKAAKLPGTHNDTFAYRTDDVFTATARDARGDDTSTIVFTKDGAIGTHSQLGLFEDIGAQLEQGSAQCRVAPEGYGIMFNGTQVPHSGTFTELPSGRPVRARKKDGLKPLPPKGAKRSFFAATTFNIRD